MSETRDGGTLLAAFLVGAAVGAVLGLLLAPAPGEETRRRFGDLARRAQEKAAEAASRARQRFGGPGDAPAGSD